MAGRKSTKYPGVQARESESRRFRGKPDICFTIDYRDAWGKRIRKDVGWASEGFSAALASEMRARLLYEAKQARTMGVPPEPEKAPLTFFEAWLLYRKDWLEAQGKRVESDEQLVRDHLAPIRDKPLSAISAHDLDMIMNGMRQKGLSAQSIRLAIGLVSRVMRRMITWKFYAGPLPFDGLVLPKLNNRRVRFLSPEEGRELLTELKKRSRDTWLMAMISLFCGLRFGEIARLRWSDVDFAGMAVHIREAKSGYGRLAVLTEDVARALREIPRGEPDALIFPSRTGEIRMEISDAFTRAVERLGLNAGITDARQKVVFHTLRHTYASWLAKSGLGQAMIADRLGHRSLQMSFRYTHLMDDSRKASADAITRIFHDVPPENQS